MSEVKFLKFRQKKRPLVSFVVPTYNNENVIEKCLLMIKVQKVSKEIIVIDNGSTDKTIKIAEKYADVVLVNPIRNMAVQRNYGIQFARGRFTCFVDSDIILTSGWADGMVKTLELYKADSMIAGVGSNFHSVTKNKVTEAQDMAWQISHHSGISKVQTMTMGNCMFRTEILKQFRINTLFSKSAEDGDLYLQMTRKGYTFLHNANLTVAHHNPTTLTALAKQYFHFGKSFWMFHIHHGIITKMLLFRFIYIPLLVVLYIFSVLETTYAILPYFVLWFLLPEMLYSFRLLKARHRFSFSFAVVNGWKFKWHSFGVLMGRGRGD